MSVLLVLGLFFSCFSSFGRTGVFVQFTLLVRRREARRLPSSGTPKAATKRWHTQGGYQALTHPRWLPSAETAKVTTKRGTAEEAKF